MKQLYALIFIVSLSATAPLWAQSYSAGDTIVTFENGYHIIKCPSGYLSLCSEMGNEILPCKYFAIGELKQDEDTAIYYWAQTENDHWGNNPLFPHWDDEELDWWGEFDLGKWQLYDANGKLALKDTFQYPFVLSYGVGVAKLLSGKEGVLTSSLAWLIPPVYDYIACITPEYGYDDHEAVFVLGKKTAADSIRFIHPFFTLPASEKLLYGIANREGKVIIPLKYESVGKPFRGLIPVIAAAGLGCFDVAGNMVIPPTANAFIRTDVDLASPKNQEYGSIWADDDTIVANNISSQKIRTLANNLWLRYKLEVNMHSNYHNLLYARKAHSATVMIYLPFQLYVLQGIYCNTAYYYDAQPVASSPSSVSFMLTYQNCEECRMANAPNCDYLCQYPNYFVTPTGIVLKTFSQQFKVPDKVLNQLLMQALAKSSAAPCLDSLKLYANVDEIAVFNTTGVDFYFDLLNDPSAQHCDWLYEEMEDVWDFPYRLKLHLPYSKLKPYLIPGSELAKTLK